MMPIFDQFNNNLSSVVGAAIRIPLLNGFRAKKVVALKRRYLILQDLVAAFQESFRVNEIRYQSGVSNMVEYIISKINMESAEVNLINARYELRVKVLEFYRGNIYATK